MALFIKSKATGNVYDDKTHVYEGGIVCAFRVNPGETPAIYCPIIVYDDAVSFGDDKLEVQTPKVVSDLFWAYDTTFVEDTRINPVTTGDAATPSLLIPAISTERVHTTPLTTSSYALYSISLNNPSNYKVQFCSNVEGSGGDNSAAVDGGGTSGGYPVASTGWVDIEKTGSYYLVRSMCSTSNDQTIYIRYKRVDGATYPTDGSYRLAPNFPKLAPYNNSGGTQTGTNNAINAYGANGGVPLLAHVWGMMGNDNPTNFKQGTYQDDLCAIEEHAEIRADSLNCLPWYAKREIPSIFYEDITRFSKDSNGTNLGKRAKFLNYSFLLTDEIMRAYIEYAIQAGLQGFMMLNYANDGYLSLFRRIFRKTEIDKREIKICYSLNFGGAGRDSYDTDLANGTWPNGTAYRDTVNEFALDIVQPWYAKARKMVSGSPTYVPIVHCLISNESTIAADKATAWVDLARIKARVLVNRPGNPLGDTFNVLMTSGPDITAGSADATGEVWNATTSYYLQPELSAGFNDSGRILDENMVVSNSSLSVANKVPMISWGYDSNPRRYFQYGESVGNFKYAPASETNTVLNYMPTLINKLKGVMANANKDLRIALCGQVGEYAEQGRDLFPNIENKRDMLDIFKDKFVTNR